MQKTPDESRKVLLRIAGVVVCPRIEIIGGDEFRILHVSPNLAT